MYICFHFQCFISMDYYFICKLFHHVDCTSMSSPSCIFWRKAFIRQSYFELFSLYAHYKVHLKHFSHLHKMVTKKHKSLGYLLLVTHHFIITIQNGCAPIKKAFQSSCFENMMCILNFHRRELPP